MGLYYTQIPANTFERLQLNAGILVDAFAPSTGVIGNILGATKGGVQFQSNPSYKDWGEDVDNCPANLMELKQIEYFAPQMSGTFLTCTPAIIKDLVAAGDVDVSDSTRVIPRDKLLTTDFRDLWWIGDYSDVNTGDSAGYLAVHLMNALNQSGFQIQTRKSEKGEMSFEYHGHYSILNQDTVPFEIYCKAGVSSNALPSVSLNRHAVTIKNGDSYQLYAAVSPMGETVTWTSGTIAKATVDSTGKVTGAAVGSSIITASITVNSVTYTDTCTVIVEAAS